jgi:diguanylate cyclase (GGDEF)-like protein
MPAGPPAVPLSMKFPLSRVSAGVIAVTVAIAVTSLLAPLSLRWVDEARRQRDHVEAQLQSLRRVQDLLVDAETGQRGFVITGSEDFLQSYHTSLALLPAEMHRMESLYTGEDSAERRQIVELLDHARKKLQELAQVIALRRDAGFDDAQVVVSGAVGKRHMDKVREITATLEAQEEQERTAYEEQLRDKILVTAGLSLLTTVMTLALLAGIGRTLQATLRLREAAAREARRTTEQLEQGMGALKRRNGEISTLGEMSRMLQSEMSLVEALEVTSLYCARLLPGTAGAIYLLRNSANLLELAARWGNGAASAGVLEPTACWGLRRGQRHRNGGPADLRCPHCAVPAEHEVQVCLPLMAYNEVLGMMHLRLHETTQRGSAEIEALAQTIAEQVALTLSNARLRQVLRDQSIKDALTGLYNRRYMEETLARELARSRRHDKPLAVVVADLDHFKRINDTHGHQAGDAVLRAAARQMAGLVRASDVACRYGGEEFVLILPDSTKEDALRKAQALCDAVRATAIKHDGEAIRVTASFGVAAWPGDGHEAVALVEAADRALYDAKRAGRDQVVAAGTAPAMSAPALVHTLPEAVAAGG